MQEEPYVWTKEWYPLAVVDDLNPLKPFATKLLGVRPCIRSCLLIWPALRLIRPSVT